MPSDAEIDALIERLIVLCNPLSEMLPERERLTAFVRDGDEAARFLAALRDDRDRLERSAFQADEDERYCTDVSEALGIEQKENAMLEARVRELEQKLERARVALEEMLFDYGDKYDGECRLKNFNELEMIDRASAALAEIGQRG